MIEKNLVFISSSHPEYKNTGLKVDSVIYLDKIATLSKRLIAGQIGVAGKKLKREINQKFPRLYKL